MLLRGALVRLARAQAGWGHVIVALALVFTLFAALGLPEMGLQTDLTRELPAGIEAIEKMKEVGAEFGSSDSVIVIIKLSDSELSGRVQDIRDPRVARMIEQVHRNLAEEREVSRVHSAYSIYEKTGTPRSLEESRALYSAIPELRDFYSRDLTATAMYIYSDIGASEERNRALVERVREVVEGSEKPPGVEVLITGTPPMRVALFELLIHDAALTMSVAALIILLLLVILQRSVIKGLVVFTPLVLSVVWTLGTMGWLGIPLSIGTVGIGAMILGLGVEYGIFVIKRYEEEKRKGRSPEEILGVVVPGVGLNITGSATTTIAGFLALLLATMPMVQKMGSTLALGIFYSYLGAIVVNPALIAILDRRGYLAD
ncbi:MAG: MMPL family transporter [Euryarchaeota archaeon]|nr:MMPL family transporter [Euryarchaeota archaeon]